MSLKLSLKLLTLVILGQMTLFCMGDPAKGGPDSHVKRRKTVLQTLPINGQSSVAPQFSLRRQQYEEAEISASPMSIGDSSQNIFNFSHNIIQADVATQGARDSSLLSPTIASVSALRAGLRGATEATETEEYVIAIERMSVQQLTASVKFSKQTDYLTHIGKLETASEL